MCFCSAVHAEPDVKWDATKLLLADRPAVSSGQSATELADATWLLAGGGAAPAQLRILDEARKTNRILSLRLNQPRTNHSASLLPDGTVMLFGGTGAAGDILDTAEVYDPYMETLSTVGSIGLLPRSGHTATVLTDGRLFIVGGIGADRHSLLEAELYNSATRRSERFDVRIDSARINQIAALLPNRSVLLWGGATERGSSRDDADLYEPGKRTTTGMGAKDVRSLVAPLDDDSIPSVLDSNPTSDAVGVSVNQLLQVRFSKRMSIASLSTKTVTLIGPAGSTEIKPVAVENGLQLFVAPKRDLEPGANYTLFIRGATDRNGLELPFTAIGFATAVQGRDSDTTGPSAISSQSSSNRGPNIGQDRLSADRTPLPQLLGSTQHPSLLSSIASALAPISANNGQQPASSLPLDDTDIWIPSQRNLNGDWTSGWKGLSKRSVPIRAEVLRALNGDPRIAKLKPSDIAGGAVRRLASAGAFRPVAGPTSVSGRALLLNGRPLANIRMSVSNRETRTDANGEFVLRNIPSGRQILVIDGGTAGTGSRKFGRYEYGLTIEAGKLNALPFVIWMTRLDAQNTLEITSPTQTPTVLKNPNIPGLELRIPTGTVIRDALGKIVTSVNMTAIPTDQPPFPIPAVPVPTYFTIQPGGAHLEGSNGAVSQGAQLIYPNFAKALPGTRIDFWNYDATLKGWYIYGRGTVTADGSQVMPDPNVRIYEFTGAMVSLPSNAPTEGPPVGPGGAGSAGAGPGSASSSGGGDPPNDGGPGNNGSGGSGGEESCNLGNAGDPVNCFTGLFLYKKMVLPFSDTAGVAPVTREYRPRDSRSRAFGIGTSMSYDFFMVGDTFPYTYQDLVLPNGGRIHYTRTSPGTGPTDAIYQTSSTPGRYFGSILKWCNCEQGSWIITLKDGATFYFKDSDASPNYRLAAVSTIVDRWGNSTTLTRGLNFNLTRITSPNGRHLNFIYDTSNRVTSASDDSGRTVAYTYDALGRLSTATDVAGSYEQYTYDSNNNMLSVRDKRGYALITNVYDSNSRVTKQTYADGTSNSFAYTLDSAGKVTQTDYTDPSGSVTRRKFNANGYITSLTEAYGTSIAQTTTFDLDPNTNLVNSVTDPLNRTTRYYYDPLGNQTKVTMPDTTSTTVTYDLTYSLPIASTDANGNITSYTYDVFGNLVQATDALGHATAFSYDGEGRLTSTTDALGNTASLGYFGADLTSATDALNRRTNVYHDSVGRITGVQDPMGRLSVTTYDILGRVSRTIDPSGAATQYGYDANGNATSVTDPTGHAITYGFDSLNRPVMRTDALGVSESWTYNGMGSVTQAIDRKSQSTTNAYDALQRPTVTTFADGKTITWTYDAGNRLTQVVDTVSGTTARSYDLLDRLTQEQTSQGTVKYTYDSAGRRTSVQVIGGATTTYAYDVANRPASIVQGTSTVSFGYDNANRRTLVTLSNGVTTQYGFDVASQLVSLNYAKGATVLGAIGYSYDNAGRRISSTGSWASEQLSDATTADHQFNAGNGLTSGNGAVQTFDNNGNPLTDGQGKSYSWDARNRLVQINQGPSIVASFTYDSFNRRTSKTIGAGATITYIHDGVNPTREQRSGAASNLINGLGVDERYARDDVSGKTFFLTDALGSTLALTNTSGSVVQTYRYEPYGQVTLGTGSPSLTNPYQYTGRENDGTGLYYYRARYYSPSQRRFISEDPIGLSGGANIYAYVGGNPISSVDPMGLAVTIEIGGRTNSSTGNSLAGRINVVSDITGEGFTGYTMENAHAGDNGDKAPISAGSYQATVRLDHTPNRVELQDVLGYKNIQIHNGSYPRNFKGCFGAGNQQSTDFLSGTVRSMEIINSIIQGDGSGSITVNVGPTP